MHYDWRAASRAPSGAGDAAAGPLPWAATSFNYSKVPLGFEAIVPFADVFMQVPGSGLTAAGMSPAAAHVHSRLFVPLASGLLLLIRP